MLTLVVQNQLSTALNLNDIGIVLGAKGASNDTVTFTRTQAQLDAMPEFQVLLNAASITVVATQSAGNAPMLSLPQIQKGKVTAIATDGGDKTATVTFATPFAAAPVVILTVDQTGSTGAVINDQIRSVTAAGFDYYLDITTGGGGGETVALHWVALY
jgi:hypothetical protein